MGSIPGDGSPGGGRRESGFPGAELLVRSTFCPAGQTCAAAGGIPGTQTGNPNPAGIGPALFDRTLRLRNNRALIQLLCNGNATCAGQQDRSMSARCRLRPRGR